MTATTLQSERLTGPFADPHNDEALETTKVKALRAMRGKLGTAGLVSTAENTVGKGTELERLFSFRRQILLYCWFRLTGTMLSFNNPISFIDSCLLCRTRCLSCLPFRGALFGVWDLKQKQNLSGWKGGTKQKEKREGREGRERE